ncbi:protein SOSEKI 5 [Macadamia integrifolia]|uniref:protein SOSEKI 5 n=1 Tax=Macadamia integrifolia TaxID=60698 RepID=UPI001C4FF706|nr:protein SOSEKI 5 [Macadamia integrifolia]
MAVSSRGRTELPALPKKWTDRDTSPERTMVWTEPKPKSERKVPVVYYLSRNGHLEHPHFMEVPLSSSEGLYLSDVINRLNILRGKGMASMYSWSSKRSYKNGFVWHDLSDNDFIYPAHGQEYVLKGSELLEGSVSFRSQATESSGTERTSETAKSSEDGEFPVVIRRRNQSWSSIDLHEYKVYKAESTGESAGRAAADASTQTYEKRRRRRAIGEEEEKDEDEEREKTEAAVAIAEMEQYRNQTTELSREEISPPPSSSSPETLESLIKADVRVVNHRGGLDESGIRSLTENNYPSGRMRASAVLMQLISCGSIAVKDCEAILPGKDGGGGGAGLSLISHYRYTGKPAATPRGASKEVGVVDESMGENPSFAGIRLEDKEYFSGSLIETKKDEFPALKRSSSYNADRRSKMELAEAEEEIEGVKAKCIPRKPKAAIKKENSDVSLRGGSVHGSSSKRE